MSLNRIVVVGRLTRDVDMRTTQDGTAVANFTVAVDRNFTNARGEKETDFIPVVVWRGLAETCARFLSKGKLVAAEGRLQVRTYEANDGSKRTISEIVADNVQFLTPKQEPSQIPESDLTEMSPLDDDIPF